MADNDIPAYYRITNEINEKYVLSNVEHDVVINDEGKDIWVIHNYPDGNSAISLFRRVPMIFPPPPELVLELDPEYDTANKQFNIKLGELEYGKKPSAEQSWKLFGPSTRELVIHNLSRVSISVITYTFCSLPSSHMKFTITSVAQPEYRADIDDRPVSVVFNVVATLIDEERKSQHWNFNLKRD
jgi:hypothetical protein